MLMDCLEEMENGFATTQELLAQALDKHLTIVIETIKIQGVQ